MRLTLEKGRRKRVIISGMLISLLKGMCFGAIIGYVLGHIILNIMWRDFK